MSRVYLDHAANSPVAPAVIEAIAAVLARPGNPSSLHASGRAMRQLLEEARESLAADLGSRASEIVFTSGGTEANNLALRGSLAARAGEGRGAARVLISAIEHPSVADLASRVPGVVRLPVDPDGVLDAAQARGAIGEGVDLVSVMWVNNETGVIAPVEEVTAWARAVGAQVHSDAVQAVGHVPVDFAASGLDLMSVSAHKVGGPVGIGALVVRRGARLSPVGFGGGQEGKLRSGTVATALAVGFAAAVREAVGRLEVETVRLHALRDHLVDALTVRLPGARVNGGTAVSPAIVNVTFAGTRADDVLLILDGAGIDCSTGSACSAGVHQPSETLLAMGRTREDASASLRFSFGPDTTLADIDALVQALPAAVARARAAFA